MRQRSSVAQNFINGEIDKALSRAGLPHNHSIRPVLDAEAQILGRDAGVNCQGESLDSRIKQLRQDLRFSNTPQQSPAKVVKTDMRELTRNLEADRERRYRCRIVDLIFPPMVFGESQISLADDRDTFHGHGFDAFASRRRSLASHFGSLEL